MNIKIEICTGAEMADMYIIYGDTNGNRRIADRVSNEFYPERHNFNHQMISPHRHLNETGAFKVTRYESWHP